MPPSKARGNNRMTLLEAISATAVHDVEHQLADALRAVAGAVAMVVTTGPDGLRGLCLLDSEHRDFFDAEDEALSALVATRQSYPDTYVDLLCISASDATGIDVPE